MERGLLLLLLLASQASASSLKDASTVRGELLPAGSAQRPLLANQNLPSVQVDLVRCGYHTTEN